ncbi:MAG: diguanylate cyclase [Pseudomonadota bacterium]
MQIESSSCLESKAEGGKHSLPTIRTMLARLVLACVLPAVLGLGLLLAHFYERGRAQISRDTVLTVRALALAVDRDLNGGKLAALALATSPNLATNDLAAFHAQAKSLLNDDFPGFNFALCNQAGQQLVNTTRPFRPGEYGQCNVEQVRRIFDSGRPAVSDVFVGNAMRRPLVAIHVPVWRDGKVAYSLAVGFLPKRLGTILSEQRLPADRIVSIFDTRGVIVAHSHEQQLVGKKVSAALLARVRDIPEGEVETSTPEGTPVYSVFSRSPASGWTVTIDVPRTTVLAELLYSIAWISAVVVALFASGLLLAWHLGGRIGRSVKALASDGDDTAPSMRMAFKEAGEVGAELLRHRRHLERLVDERTAQLEKSNRLLEVVYATAPVGLSFVDADLRYVMVNQHLAAINGRAVRDHIGHPLTELADTIGQRAAQAHRQVLDTGMPLLNLEVSAALLPDRRQTGHWIVNCYPVFGPEQRIVGVNGVVIDISERKAAEEAIRQLAFFDALTGLPNRRLLMERLRLAVDSSARTGCGGALMFIDLDHFKALNDTLGHDKGDLLLEQVAARLVLCMRAGDTIARFGGDEFVALLVDLSGDPGQARAQAELVGKQVLATFSEPYDLAGQPYHSTPSIGITLFDDHKNGIAGMLKRADIAMYRAKAAGRNTLRFFT